MGMRWSATERELLDDDGKKPVVGFVGKTGVVGMKNNCCVEGERGGLVL